MLSDEKIRFLEKRGRYPKDTYLPSPGVPADIVLRKGDWVLIDVRSRKFILDEWDKQPFSVNTNISMEQLNGKWVRVKSFHPRNNLSSSFCRLEDSDSFWYWYHFKDVHSKQIPFFKESLTLPFI